jgi:hypothetical protein
MRLSPVARDPPLLAQNGNIRNLPIMIDADLFQGSRRDHQAFLRAPPPPLSVGLNFNKRESIIEH